MATYNGEAYIQEQLDSILIQLGKEDEVVVCDDRSNDRTLEIINAYRDARVRVYRNEKRLGHVKNFEKAMLLSKGGYIFLADQDDIWLPNRVRMMLLKFEENPGVELLASNFDLIDADGVRLGEFRELGGVKRSRLGQVLAIFAGRAPYFGCTFLLRRSLLRRGLPIPRGVESHDIWLALIASLDGKVTNLPGPTLLHRMHGRNVTTKKRRSFIVVLRSRLLFMYALALRMFLPKI